MKFLALVLGLVTWVVANPMRAEACGSWTMKDVEKSYSIYWSINSGTISKGKRRVGALYLDTKATPVPRVVSGKTTLFDIVDGKLRKRGKQVGTIDGTKITIGKHSYVVELGAKRDYHGMPAWPLKVIRQGARPATVVETAEAPDLCSAAGGALLGPGASIDDDAAQKRVLARVAFYLAWRG